MNSTYRATSRTLLFLGILAAFTGAMAQTGYRQVDLAASVPNLAANIDHRIVTPWGIAVTAGQPFRIANNGSKSFSSYDASGAGQVFGGNIAGHAGNAQPAPPTGVVANATGMFAPRGSLASPFIFASEDGTISGEYADSNGNRLQNTVLAVDNSQRGAVYTGIAIMTPDCCAPYLAVADFKGGFIDTYSGAFQPLSIAGTFADTTLPAGYAPYNLQVIGNQVFVTYALQDADRLHPAIGAGNGMVDVFDLAGNFVKRFASNGRLNAPWGVTKASANFGSFSNDILIGNFGDGTINAFDAATGEFAGTLNDGAGNPIVNPGLHGMVFGSGATGDLDTLYVAAGLAGGPFGAFGAIAVNTLAGAPDFSVATPSGNASLALGQSATFTFTATPMAGFLGSVAFSCSAPAGITCGFNPANVPTGATPGSTTLTVTRSASAMQSSSLAGLALPCFFLTGFGAIGAGISRSKKTKRIFSLMIVALLLVVVASVGCGGTSMQIAPQTASIAITAQSGTIAHTSLVTVTLQ